MWQLLGLRQVRSQELGHGKASHPLSSKDLGHLLVGSKELLVLRVLEVVLLEICPQLLHTFGPEMKELQC